VIHGNVNGQPVETTISGYLDIGIIDTMEDLFVNFFGAVIFSVIGYFYIKYRKEGRNSKFVSQLMLTRITISQTGSEADARTCDKNSE
jgi:hypothetical protein